MANIFEVTDPLGRKIFCTNEQWVKHVVEFKPIMAKYQNEVSKTIENPDSIHSDAERNDRDCYYRRWKSRWPLIKVVVEFKDADVGNVVTAFPSRSIKPKELLKHPIRKK